MTSVNRGASFAVRRLARMWVACLLAMAAFGLLCGALQWLAVPRSTQAQVTGPQAEDYAGAHGYGAQVHSVLSVDASQFPTLTADVYLVDGLSRPLETSPDEGLNAALMQGDTLIDNGVSPTIRTAAINELSLPRRLVVIWDVVDNNPASFQEVCLGLHQTFGEVPASERIAVITATDGPPVLAQNFISSREALQAVTANARRASSTRTEMYDALMMALSETEKLQVREPMNTSRAIIIVSDEGGDWRPAQAATKPITAVVARAQALGVPVHLILHKPGTYSGVISQSVASTGGLVQVIPAKRSQVAASIDVVRQQMNHGFFRVTVMGNRAVVTPSLLYTLALAVPSEPLITRTHPFSHSHLFFSVQGITPGQFITQVVPLSVSFALGRPPFELSAASMDLLAVDNTAPPVRLARSIRPDVALTDVWSRSLPYTPTRLLEITGGSILQARIMDVKGNSGTYAVGFVVPPPFVVGVANTPTRLAERAGFTPTLLVQPQAWLQGKGLTVTTQVIFSDSLRRGTVYTVTAGETLLPVPGDRMTFGDRHWRVILRDQLGRVFETDAQRVRVDSSAWVLTLIKWVVGLLGLLAALALLTALALRLSRQRVGLVMENLGNAACAYEVQVVNSANLFGFDVYHGGYALQRHYQTELIYEPAPDTGAATTKKRRRKKGTTSGRSTQSSSTSAATPAATPPTSRNAAQGIGQAASAVADAAGGAAGKIVGLGTQIPGVRNLFGGAQQTLRDVETQGNVASYQAKRAATMADKAERLASGQRGRADGSAASAPNSMPASADESWRPGDVVDPKPPARVARLVKTGPPWWRTPEIGAGKTQELSLWVRPGWPFVHRTCDAVLRSRPVHLAQGDVALADDAAADAAIKETTIEVPMERHGLVWILGVLVVLAFVIGLFARLVWPCLVGNCFVVPTSA